MKREVSPLERRHARAMQAFWLLAPVFGLLQAAALIVLVRIYAMAPRLYLVAVVSGSTLLSYRAARHGTMALWRRAERARQAMEAERMLQHDDGPTRNLRLPRKP